MKWIPRILSLIFLWGLVVFVILYIEPELIRDIMIPGLYLPFFALITITIWYTLSIFTKSIAYSLLITITIIFGLALTMLGLMHIGLGAVLLLTLLMESWYIYHRHEKIHPTNEQKDRGAGL